LRLLLKSDILKSRKDVNKLKPEEIALSLTLKGIEHGSIVPSTSGDLGMEHAEKIAEAYKIILDGVRKSYIGED